MVRGSSEVSSFGNYKCRQISKAFFLQKLFLKYCLSIESLTLACYCFFELIIFLFVFFLR